MAEYGEPHPLAMPLGRHRVRRQLSRDDIGNQARYLMSGFIYDRMRNGGIEGVPAAEALIEPGTPQGPPVEHIREVATCLRKIGDELDNDKGLQRLLDQVSPEAPQETFQAVAKSIFQDGVFNWGRVVALFYFAFKMVVKALKSEAGGALNLVRSIVEWVVRFIIDYCASWIIGRGGWEAVQEHFGATVNQTLAVLLSGVVVSALFILWRNRGHLTT